MGCGGSKIEDQPLVTLCRERKEFLKAASNQRYALAAAHMFYFRSLKDVGEALRRFVDEELVIATVSSGGGSSNSPDSPVLTLPSDEGKKKRKKKKKKQNHGDGDENGSSSTSLSHSLSLSHDHHSPDEDSHLHFHSSSEDGSGSGSGSILHNHGSSETRDVPVQETETYYPYRETEFSPPVQERENYYPYRETGFSPPVQETDNYYPYRETQNSPSRVYSYSYFMQKSPTEIPSFIYQDPQLSPRRAQWNESGYSGYPQYGGMGGYFGVPMNSGSPSNNNFYDPYRDVHNNRPPEMPAATPPPPPPPEVSAWGFLDPFQSMEDSYGSYYPSGVYGVRSVTSSPDSVEVRQREGIPDLEDDTEQEPVNEVHKEKQRVKEKVKGNFGESTSRGVPSKNEDNVRPVEANEIKSSSNESILSTSTGEEELAGKKGASSEVDGLTAQDGGSSKSSNFTTLSTHGTRDIQEVVKEIKDDFEIASDYGKEVAVMLEVGKLPFQHRGASLRVIFSRIQKFVAPPTSSSHSLSRQSQGAALSVRKMAKVKYDDFGDFRMNSGSLSSTLERLYAWEKKLYKEVKDEEKLRVTYEKKCKRLKDMDAKGAEVDKVEATQASIRKLLTKINVAIKTVDGIARNIHKLRDEELQPQITELINGLIRMWKSMLKCHQKQFQAIIESKSRSLMANIGSQGSSSLRATVELELELRNWCKHFSSWINSQKAYVESLNGWLLKCLLHEPEETADGIMPFSPSRVGAPPIFVICNDWYHAMERLSESAVANTMHSFAMSLHQLWERQDEEQRQRLRAEYLVKDFEKRLRTLRKEQIKMQWDRDAPSEKSAISVVPSESGVSPLDDLKVDLDSMRMRLEEEKAKHKATVKQVHEAASSSLQAGLIPIFEALGNFTSDTLKAYEQVRVQSDGAP